MKKIYILLSITGFLFISLYTAQAQYGLACSEYGIMAYEDYSGYCKCRSGYVFQDSYAGTQCVSADSICSDEYGPMSQYDSYSGNCECSYGYVLGKDSIGRTRCISENESCQNKYGYNSRSTYGGGCECSYGYVLGKNMFGETECIDEDQMCRDEYGYNSSASYGGGCECNTGYVIDDGQCVNGDQVCRSEHGYYSSYNDSTNRCECDEDYTFNHVYECVEKQNNVYFKLLDVNFGESKILIKSEYDYRNYIVRYGIGCFDSAISSYLGSNLVVNLGTDFDVDMFDTIVLQNHSQTCSIMSREVTYDDSFPEEVEEDIYYYTPPPSRAWVPATVSTISKPNIGSTQNLLTTPEMPAPEPLSENIQQTGSSTGQTSTTSTTTNTAAESEASVPDSKPTGFFMRIINFFKNLF